MELKNSNCDENQQLNMIKLKNSNCDKTWKLKLWLNTKNILKKIKNSKCEEQKTQIVTKLNNSKCDLNQIVTKLKELKLWQNFFQI